MIKILLAAMISLSSSGFTNEASEEWNDELREAIQSNENEVVDHYDEDKIYINPDKIHPTNQGVYLNLNDEEFIFVSTLNSDNHGCYVQCGIGGFNINPKSTCSGCGREYLIGGCRNKNCLEYQRQQSSKENYTKESSRIGKNLS